MSFDRAGWPSILSPPGTTVYIATAELPPLAQLTFALKIPPRATCASVLRSQADRSNVLRSPQAGSGMGSGHPASNNAEAITAMRRRSSTGMGTGDLHPSL